MSEVDFGAELKDLKGNSINVTEGDEVRCMLLSDVCINSLMTVSKDEKPDGRKSIQKYNLASKISKANGKIVVKLDELVLLKECIGKFYAPLVIGRAFELLCPEELSKEV
ncbi:MAG: hypothetical protein WC307_06350 [Candidatus Nanoarchaeia archaeon]|jgi:hypothetical protein